MCVIVAQVAAKSINKQCLWMNVTAYHGKFPDIDSTFYSSLKCIISGLDNVEAKRWLNSTICGLVQLDEDGNSPIPETIKPIVDGGTEGFSGQGIVILPRITSCFECSLDALPPQNIFSMYSCRYIPNSRTLYYICHYVAMAKSLLFPRRTPKYMQWVN
jgi:ubiquitin-activating enzyme E1 C